VIPGAEDPVRDALVDREGERVGGDHGGGPRARAERGHERAEDQQVEEHDRRERVDDREHRFDGEREDEHEVGRVRRAARRRGYAAAAPPLQTSSVVPSVVPRSHAAPNVAIGTWRVEACAERRSGHDHR
jgi:hypothetical protein